MTTVRFRHGSGLSYIRIGIYFYLFYNSRDMQKTDTNDNEVKNAHSMVVTGYNTANVTAELN